MCMCVCELDWTLAVYGLQNLAIEKRAGGQSDIRRYFAAAASGVASSPVGPTHTLEGTVCH